MASRSRRSSEANAAIYQRRKERAIASGYSGYHGKRTSPDAERSRQQYYERLAEGKGKIGRNYRELLQREGIPFDRTNKEQAAAFARMLNRSYHQKSVFERRKIQAQWIESLDLSAMDKDWLLRQLGAISP